MTLAALSFDDSCSFAAMFPDKIERMILDGVMEANNYYAGKFK